MSKSEVNLNIIGGQQKPLYVYKPVILQSNMADDTNILDVDAFIEDNRKYIIRWNFDLDGKTLEVGANCLLEFDGGSLSNGTLALNDTIVISPLLLKSVLNAVDLQGNYSLTEYCELSKYEEEGAILPLNKVYVSYGLPIEQRVYVSMVGTQMHNNIVFALSRGNEDSEYFPYPNSLMVFTTTDNSVDEYAYNITYSWMDAPESLKRLFGWEKEVNPLDIVMCNIKDYENNNKILPLGKAYHFNGMPVESRYFSHTNENSVKDTLVFAVTRGRDDDNYYPYPQSIIVFTAVSGGYKFDDVYSWEDAAAEYKKLFGWQEPEPTPEPQPITGDQLADSVVDDEDLCFNASRQIQFKDKTAGDVNGKGRKYLRKNIQPIGIPFDGIVEGSTTYQGGTLLGIYYDIINDYFVAKMSNMGTVYYSKFADSPAASAQSDSKNYSDPDYYENPTEDLVFWNRDDSSVWQWADATQKLIRQSTEPTMDNVLLQSMINEQNTIYHLQYGYHLNFATITIPMGSVLVIDGGHLHHGTINLYGCRVAPDYMSLAEQETDESALTITGVPADGAIKTMVEEEGVDPEGNRVYVTIGGQWKKIFDDSI